MIRIADPIVVNRSQGASLYSYLEGELIIDKVIKEGYGVFPLGELIFMLAIGNLAIFVLLIISNNDLRLKRECE